MEKLEIKAEVSIDDAGTITGIAWPFGAADSVGDVIEKGAFRFEKSIPILVEHDDNQVVGIWESVTETDVGLEVKGRLFIEGVGPARAARRRLQAGRSAGLSIGYRLHDFTPRVGGGRSLTNLTVAEISLCQHPVNRGAGITEVKSMEQENTHMENENTAEAAVELKAANDNIAALTARLDKLEAKAKRPVAANDNEPVNGLKAFGDSLRTTMLERKALTISAPSTGGELVPDDFSAQVLEKVRAASPVRQLASTISVAGSLLQIPRLVNRVVPASVTEVGAKPESEPTFEQIDIKPHAMGVLVPVSRSLLEDNAVNLGDYLSNHIVAECATLESQWFVTGNGTTQAEGVLTSTEVEEIEAAAIDTDALLDLFYGIKSTYSLNGSWLMNRKTMRVVRGLRDSDGNLLWQAGLQAGQPGLLLGKPVFEADHMPDVAEDATPIMFGDFARGYLITDRIAFEPHVDYDTRWGNDIVVFGGRRRVGGKVVMGEALAKLKIAA
ncbi:phage major capsid protein [Paradevosia shaoguanensis]|uniref:phage major capsid protein n=1 Tax=Paradevosia shaoguanensis TaxID=1335043 RepID=UPI001933D972|nr:phage major capsid protein [Paradevosia shaoguanensis]